MSEEQQPRVHPQDPAEGPDADQRGADREPQESPQAPAEGGDDETTDEGDA